MPTATVRLLADIGGTNARFALYENGAVRASRVLRCVDYPDVVTAIRSYLRDIAAQPREAAIAVAAPLQGDAVRMTNHPWEFSVAAVRRQLGFDRLLVLNDFTALALAIPHLQPAELQQVGGDAAVPLAPIGLIGPGTGLGVSGLVHSGQHWIPLQGEGGHVTLSAANDHEASVLAILRQRFDHVSAERVLSGPGLVNLYEALMTLDASAAQFADPATITEQALNATNATACQALEMFCAMLGTVAGNLALTLGAVGGVYIGGGIVPRLGEFFVRSAFRARFEDKGRYRSYLTPIPVQVIRAELPAFVGLARAFTDPAPSVTSE